MTDVVNNDHIVLDLLPSLEALQEHAQAGKKQQEEARRIQQEAEQRADVEKQKRHTELKYEMTARPFFIRRLQDIDEQLRRAAYQGIQEVYHTIPFECVTEDEALACADAIKEVLAKKDLRASHEKIRQGYAAVRIKIILHEW